VRIRASVACRERASRGLLTVFRAAVYTAASDEAYLSTPQPSPEAHARLSRSHAHARRPRRDRREAAEGACQADGVRAASPALGMRRVNRLRPSDGFSLVYRTGTRIRGRAVTTMATREGSGVPLIGVVCSREVGTAVARNRIKRRLRAAANSVIGHLSPGALVVLQGNEAAATETFSAIEEQVRNGLQRAGMLGG
jgi:ribonuclease P protein component